MHCALQLEVPEISLVMVCAGALRQQHRDVVWTEPEPETTWSEQLAYSVVFVSPSRSTTSVTYPAPVFPDGSLQLGAQVVLRDPHSALQDSLGDCEVDTTMSCGVLPESAEPPSAIAPSWSTPGGMEEPSSSADESGGTSGGELLVLLLLHANATTEVVRTTSGGTRQRRKAMNVT